MPADHDDAICLRHREWSETSQTVTLLTRAHGLVHGLAKGSLREKAPFSGGFELLQLGELGFINKPDRDLLLLTEWDLIDPFSALRTEYRSATAAMLLGTSPPPATPSGPAGKTAPAMAPATATRSTLPRRMGTAASTWFSCTH